MAKLEAECSECGRKGQIVTVLAGSEETDASEGFLCYECWKERKKKGAKLPESTPIGWLKE